MKTINDLFPSLGLRTQQRWTRIIPVTFVLFTIAFLDRANISMVLPSITQSFHITSRQAGDVAGVFYWGYVLLQIPAGHLASHWSTKGVISILLIAMILFAIGCGLARTWRELWVMRLMLGISEGGVWPATLILLSNWFPRSERARSNAWFMLSIPCSIIILGPLCGWMLGRWSWRVMLISQGVLPLIWLAVWLIAVADHPEQATWLSAGERAHLERCLEPEVSKFKPLTLHDYVAAMLDPQVLLMTTIYFLSSAGCSGYLFWLPTALGGSRGREHIVVGVLTAVPFVVTCFMMIFNSRHSDAQGERRWHVVAAFASAGVFLLLAVTFARQVPWLAYVFICLAAGGPYAALGPFWANATETLLPVTLGAAMGLITGLGNIGGYFGPLWVGSLLGQRGNLIEGFGLMGVLFLVASGLALLLAHRPKRMVAHGPPQ